MMQTTEINTYLGRVTWLPGWSFQAYDDPWEGKMMVLQGTVPDAFGDGEIVLKVHTYMSPNDYATPTALYRYLMYRLWRIYGHEAREFFRVDGEVIFNPHET